MSFISYAQNYEDVMLYRALKNVEKGAYVDVGANDPIHDSVTKAFYERGWRGINIEPIRYWYDKLIIDRPEDINLNVAISDQSGILQIYDVQDTGLSTINREMAEKHAKEQGFQYQAVMVPALTLDNVFQGFNREIHFLKVDVEGAEKQVLASLDLTQTRPWIILVEANKPSSQEENYEEWETLLIDQKYLFVYFDGLNRFYIAEERRDLSSAFTSPPNVFDGFMQLREWNTQISLGSYKAQLAQLEANLHESRRQWEASLQESQQQLQSSKFEQQRLTQLLSSIQDRLKALENEYKKQKIELQHSNSEVNRVANELRSVYESTSWKISYPLRLLGTFAKWFYHGSVAWLTFAPNSRPRRITKKILISAKREINTYPRLKTFLTQVISRFPRLEERLRKEGQAAPDNLQVQPEINDEALEQLTPRARKIYQELRTATQSKKEGN